jgi:hypothetical protein
MIHFQKGENWEDGPMSFHVETKQNIEDTIVYGRVHDLEGLSNRQIAIVEMKVRMGLDEIDAILLEEPKANCVKEGLWAW